MICIKKIILSILSIFIFNNEIYSWEVYDKVIATVNETPIIESELVNKFERLMNQKKITPKKFLDEKSRLLDKFIEEALVEQTAEKESIIVSPEKVDNQIQKIMNRADVDSIESFKKRIEKTENITFEEYKEEIRKSLIFEQVMSIAIGISPPSTKDAEDWYRENKKNLGYEINIEHIMIKLENETYEENKRANKIASDLYKKIISGQSFENIAKEYSEDPATKNNGGKLGWIVLSNLAKNDSIFANNIYKEFIINKKKYAIIKSSTGYHIIKFNGKRITSFETVKDDIFNLLYQKRMMEQFKRWVYQKKSESDIKIFMEDYIEAKSSS